MTRVLHEIIHKFMRRVTQQPKRWRFVCFVSSIVGFVFYILSSSFIHLFGKRNWWKTCVYIVVSFFICLSILFTKRCHGTTSLPLKVHLVFTVFLLGSVYNFFFDKQKENPDSYSLISTSAFAISSLGLSKQTHFGVEVDLLYFFCGYLVFQLMKIKFVLVSVGASFSYILFQLHSYLENNPTENDGHLGFQMQDRHSVAIQIDRNLDEDDDNNTLESAPVMNFDALQENLDDLGSNIQVHLQRQKGNSDDGVRITLDELKREFAKMNEKLNHVIWKQVMRTSGKPVSFFYKMLTGTEDIAGDLHKLVEKMVEDGLQISECCNIYNIFRFEFLNKCLCRLGLHEVNLCDDRVENEIFGRFINVFDTALKILLPNERMIWRQVFSGFSDEYSIFSSLEWRRMEIELWAKSMVFETRTRYNSQETIGCRVHPLAHGVMKCMQNASKDKENATYFQIPEVIQMLEHNLEAKSKCHKNPALRYLFMLNNNRYIQMTARHGPLKLLLGEDWTQIQASKVTRNIRKYLTYSWNKVMELMKNDRSIAYNVQLSTSLFQTFSDICEVESTRWILDKRLRRSMIQSIKKMLLPRYEKFNEGFKDDVLDKHDDDGYIKFETSDIEARLDRLYLGNKSGKDLSSTRLYTQGYTITMNAESSTVPNPGPWNKRKRLPIES